MFVLLTGPILKISWKSIHEFFCDVADGQTDKQTDKPTEMKTLSSPFGGGNEYAEYRNASQNI